MMTSEGFGGETHLAERVFRIGGAVQVIGAGAARLGQRGEVTRIFRGGAYNVVVKHEDGRELPYRPEELACLAG